MPAYRENRRPDRVPRLNAITKNEAAETTDLRRLTTYELERERLHVEIGEKLGTSPKPKPQRSFADVLRTKK